MEKREMEMASKGVKGVKGLKVIPDVIPQVSYDIIGRLAPGFTIISIASLIFMKPTILEKIFLFLHLGLSPMIIMVLGVSILSYVLGALLGGLGFAISSEAFWNTSYEVRKKTKEDIEEIEGKVKERIKERIKIIEKIKEKLKIIERIEGFKITECSDIYLYAYLQMHCPQAGARLTKLRAEQHMCRVIMVGSIVLFLVTLLMVVFGKHTNFPLWVIVIGLLVQFSAAACFNHHLKMRFIRTLYYCSYLICNAELDPCGLCKIL